MNSSNLLQLQPFTPPNTELLLTLMSGFNQEENIEFDRDRCRSRIQLASQYPDLIKLWFIAKQDLVVGYIALSFTFSFEFGGLLATVDEIYLAPEHRGQGIGTIVLERVSEAAIACGATTLCAEVSDHKPWLFGFYQRAGFEPQLYRPYYKPLSHSL